MILCAYEKISRSGVHSNRSKLAFVKTNFSSKEVEKEPETLIRKRQTVQPVCKTDK